MNERTVKCAKLGKELAGLPAPPFPGPLGQRIFDGISREAWDQWQERAPEVMRSRRLSMGDPAGRKALYAEMEDFLFEQPAAPELPADAPIPEGFVRCAKLGRVLPRLKKPPLPGALGERIFAEVSEPGFKLWADQEVIVMNHYGLSLADPEARKFLLRQMEEFFFGEGARLPADWTPPAAGGKGAPAPRRK
jgi:Fe-S cluster biosynthesis and repair protein YggX